MARLFGTDGVRGVANRDLTPELAFRLGRAHGYFLASPVLTAPAAHAHAPSARDRQRPQVAVGRDTRISGEMLEGAYLAGLCSSGADVVLLGVIPTPGVAWLVGELGADGGAVISASHNPVEDNGIKLLNGRGFKLSDGEEAALERLLTDVESLPRPVGGALGRVVPAGEDAEGRYARHVAGRAPARLEGLKVVLDCAHGAAFRVAPRLFRELGADVVVLNASPDGVNINAGCGSTEPGGMQRAVVEQGARLGLAFDGDADRCLACDETGTMVDGDPMLLLFARWLREHGKLPNDLVVTTVMANFGLEEALRREGIRMARTPVGDRYVLATMLEEGAVLGGEQSGHIIFLDHNTTGDGLLTAVLLAGLVAATGRPLSELAAGMTRMPQLLVNVPARDKQRLQDDPAIAEAIRRVEDRLSSRGRLLVRPSGTEPLVRVMAEGPDAAELDELVGEIARVIELRMGA